MQKTLEELLDIDRKVGAIYMRVPTIRGTKFGYAYDKFYSKNLKSIVNEMREKLMDIAIQNALEDKNTGEILVDKGNDRGFRFSKEGLKNCILAEKKILEEYNPKVIEFEPFISPYVPEELTENEREMLTGMIL